MNITTLSLFLALSTMAIGQDYEFTLVSYNSLRYSPTNIDDRHPQLRMVMDDLQPDVLCVQELSGQGAAQMYMDSVLNIDSTTYSMANFVDGNGLDVSLYFKTSKFTYISTTTYPTQLRDIYHYQIIPKGLTDTLHVFGLHLKASPGTTNQLRRKDEVDVLRQATDNLKPDSYFLVCGDFNIYSGNEPAYARLKEKVPNKEGHFIDRFSLAGTWNNANYAKYHTQSPRTTQFNGGASGGMDDRFDMILFSAALNDSLGLAYVPKSMYPYGNDGLHYNKAINEAPLNAAVGQTMADALHFVSDHIPVVAKIKYRVSGVSLPEVSTKKVELFNYAEGFGISNPDNKILKVAVYQLDGRKLMDQEITETQNINFSSKGAFLVTVIDSDTLILNKLLIK